MKYKEKLKKNKKCKSYKVYNRDLFLDEFLSFPETLFDSLFISNKKVVGDNDENE